MFGAERMGIPPSGRSLQIIMADFKTADLRGRAS
jgi:hypothetical protein